MNNMFMLVGRISKDIELRTTTNGMKIVDLNLAVPNGKDDTTFISVNLFGNLAEATSKYSSKGDLVGVMGMIKNHNWQDKEGKKHYDFQFIGNKVTFLSKKKDVTKVDVPKNSKTEYDNLDSDIKLSDADLPF